ncbi:uncharacterized protein LOC115737782 isoform X3 [Rhodamnia argentea]|uniref:Uncharacterized protein LOC115737782 isoform X3 n=1 Tax=Rhodamnia argentea TaxID=178133 RepID=A0A8B8NUU9_9MYRT|nr:uncharacterized protein LOC115737782 isoform X3 [Rhodamnia argentea]
MAQFAAQGRVKLLFNGEGVSSSSSALEPKDLFFCNSLASAQFRRHGLRFLRSASARLSWHPAANESRRLRAEFARSSAGADSFDYYDYDSDAESDDLACFRGLVLDVAYRPVDVVSWRRAICLEFMEKVRALLFADVLEYYDQTVDSPSGSFYIPAVLRVPHLLQVIKRRIIRTNLNRKNIFYRDSYSCQSRLVPDATQGKAPKDYDILAIPLTSDTIKMLKMRKEMPGEWLQYLAKRSS